MNKQKRKKEKDSCQTNLFVFKKERETLRCYVLIIKKRKETLNAMINGIAICINYCD